MVKGGRERLRRAWERGSDKGARCGVIGAAMDGYEPKHPHLVRVWERLNAGSRAVRVRDAQRRKEVLGAVEARPRGESERAAIRRLVPAVDRSTFRRWHRRYREYGFDGLLDWRMPPRSPMSDEVRAAICTLRRVDPNMAVELVIAHVAKHHDYAVSGTTVKRVLRDEGLARRRGPATGEDHGEHRLELGGMKLVEAACVETGYLDALTEAVVGQVEAAEKPEEAKPADTEDRDEYGRFLPSYNERFRKQEGDEVGPGFRSVGRKRKGLDPERLHVSQVRLEIVERKLLALLVSPLLGNGRWDGIRVARGELLGELCGFPYMPATLDLFTRELKYIGVSSTLWEVHARLWLHQSREWGDERRAVVLYVDGTTKAVWTRLFSQATKVSDVGRVMPGLELVSFHSGYGVPLWMLTHSGRAPLVRAVPEALERAEEVFGGSAVGRVVVIDAEGNSVPFLRGLEEGTPPRAWVTRLKPSFMKGKRVFNRNNYREYRNGDRVRMGLCDFPDPKSEDGTPFRMRVVEVERRGKGTVTYLGASMLLHESDWKASDLADLYFDRWPNQEANFRLVNRAVGFKDVHGYGKELVDNITVVTKLDEKAQKIRNLEGKKERKQAELEEKKRELHEEGKLLRRDERRQETVTRQLDGHLAPGSRVTAKARRLLDEQKELTTKLDRGKARITRGGQAVKRKERQLDTTKARLDEHRKEAEELESRRKVFKHDVELDSLFSLLKVGLVLLITYILNTYLGGARMEPVTFLERVATLPARLRRTPHLEIVTFEYNRRDPDVMALLTSRADAINALGLPTRSGRTLRIQVDPPPPPPRPPPGRKRVKSKDRFGP